MESNKIPYLRSGKGLEKKSIAFHLTDGHHTLLRNINRRANYLLGRDVQQGEILCWALQLLDKDIDNYSNFPDYSKVISKSKKNNG